MSNHSERPMGQFIAAEEDSERPKFETPVGDDVDSHLDLGEFITDESSEPNHGIPVLRFSLSAPDTTHRAVDLPKKSTWSSCWSRCKYPRKN